MTDSSDLLHYQFQPAPQPNNHPTLVFIHGLFGDMNNLGVIARAFSKSHDILRLDLRNHGQSFHSDNMNYNLMAQDLLRLLAYLELNNVILIGHSMGGKTAMAAASLQPERIDKLVVIDIAPVKYGAHGHDDVFAALLAVKHSSAQNRQEAKPLLAQHIHDQAVQQFMLKSFDPASNEKFRFNLTALWQNYHELVDWQPCHFDKPTLFIKGTLSNYIIPEYTQATLAQFPQASAFTINGGHWIHAEKPDAVIRAIERFIK